jgi:hypothetical protein
VSRTILPPTREGIPADKLGVDREVQRDYTDQNRVAKIVKDFHPEALGTLIISRREDGFLHIIDGAHRQESAVKAGYTDPLDCAVYEGLTKAEEAAMFRLYNNTRAVNVIDRFRVRVKEGDPAAVVLNGILQANGWKVSQSKGRGCFAAVAAFEEVYNRRVRAKEGGSAIGVCGAVIAVITEAWGLDSDGVRAELVKGIGLVYLRYGQEIDGKKLVRILQGHKGNARGLSGRAKGLAAARGGLVADSVAEILVNELNKNKPERTRLPEYRAAA